MRRTVLWLVLVAVAGVAAAQDCGPRLASVGGRPTEVRIQGEFAFVAGSEGLQIYNIGDATSPELVASLSEIVEARDFVIDGEFGYLLEVSRLRVLDLSDPRHPVEVGSVVGVVGRLELQGDTLYAANASVGVYVFDVSDPTNPVRVSTYPIAATDIRVQGGIGYLATRDSTVQILDVTEQTIKVWEKDK
eukprot:TRINITY_DN15475_c1_g1_i4.p1 TRINITY_DN15475_c1_g1~~TRINITY_DN15475_c1_g1_i4.p1  ORF type:complete len:190 (+),score=14.37 TRINITY_DN15475_c1_g1_i4:119-688(+)